MTTVSRTRATFFPCPANDEAGARRGQDASPASRILHSFGHHFGDRCVRARVSVPRVEVNGFALRGFRAGWPLSVSFFKQRRAGRRPPHSEYRGSHARL